MCFPHLGLDLSRKEISVSACDSLYWPHILIITNSNQQQFVLIAYLLKFDYELKIKKCPLKTESVTEIFILGYFSFCLKDTEETLIRPHILWHLFWVYSVCCIPLKRTMLVNSDY